MFQSVSEACEQVHNASLGVLQREDAVHYLGRNPTPEAIDCLVQALTADDFGVRWAAAVALAEQGDRALEPVLRALTQNSGNRALREGVYHIIYYNRDPAVRRRCEKLLNALKGPAADVAAMQVAYELLQP